MAQTTEAADITAESSVEDAFTADRAMFWNRFTGFTKGAVIAVVVLLILMFLFLR